MISSKLASLEARIARLESVLKNKTASASPEVIEYLEDNLHRVLVAKYGYGGRSGGGYFVSDIRNHSMVVSRDYSRATITVQPEGVEVKFEHSLQGRSEKKHFAIISRQDQNFNLVERQLNLLIGDIIEYLRKNIG